MSTLEDTLEHYGVKGMKWGTRRSKAQLAKENMSEDAKAAKAAQEKAKKTGLDSLSNEELKTLKTRMGLEREIAQLTSDNDTRRKSEGRKELEKFEDVLTNQIRTKAAKEVVNYVFSG